MKLDKKTLAILLLCLAAVLALAYFASQGQQAQSKPGENAGQNQAQDGSAANKTQQGNASKPPQGGQQTQGNAASPKPGGNITGGGTAENLPGAIAGGQNQPARVNLTNATNATVTSNITIMPNITNITNLPIIYPLGNITIPPLNNVSALEESDFMVVDDSLPSLLTSQGPTELPAPPNAP